MPWERKGLIYSADGRFPHVVSHATCPTPLLTSTGLRIYVASRDQNGKGSVAYVDVAPDDPGRLLGVGALPSLVGGPRGSLDDSGVQPNFAHADGDRIFLYYMGYNLGVTFSYRNCTGLAVSEDGGVTFERAYPGPVMERSIDEPYFSITPMLLRDGDGWRCWYTSGVGYREVDGAFEWDFVLRHATSPDGVRFNRDPGRCIEPLTEGEVHTRAWVLKDKERYKMWLSYRTLSDFRGGAGSYRIGYAESADGVSWRRDDAYGGLERAEDGPGAVWDGEMACFGAVLDVGDRRYLFYNGNGFGRTGFGYALWHD